MTTSVNIFNGFAVFGISGESDTGKTELLCDIVEELSERGYEAATIKHTRGDFTIDQEGKDTWRHSQSGAKLVILSTPSETDFLLQSEMALEEILTKIEAFGKYDAVLIEGMKEEDIPQIVLDEEKPSDLDRVVDRIEEEIEKKNILIGLPGLECQKCGFDSCRELAEAVYDGKTTLDECVVLERKESVDTQLYVDGEPLPLSGFPSEMVKKTIKGMISSLKGIDDIDEVKKIEIEIDEE